jgi:hypothetical protein
MPLLAASLLLAAASGPHVDTVSYAQLCLGGPQLELLFELDLDHVMQAVEAPPPLGEDWSDEDVRNVRERAIRYLSAHWQLWFDGLPEAWTPGGFERLLAFDPLLQKERAIRVAFRFSFPAPRRDARATLAQSLFDGIELAHRHFLVLEAPDGKGAELAVPSGTPFHFTLPDAGPGAAARRLRARAIEGAGLSLSAPWLLLFLAALLVAPTAPRERLRSAGAALAAASAAFALVAADWIAPAAWASTAAAALSVAYVAAENRFARAIQLRTATAALFGLVHGMALAPRLPAGLLPPTATEAAAFAATALLVSGAAALAAATLAGMARAFAVRATGFVVDGLLVLAGAAGIALAIASRGSLGAVR